MPDLDVQALHEAIDYVERWLTFRRERKNLPGLVFAVRYRDEVLVSKALGFAQLEPAVPMTTRHAFRIASHSKTFTATAIMQLVEQDKVRLDDRVSAHLPWLTSTVTVRQLLNHAGGIIRDGVDADFWRVERPFPDLAELRALAPELEVLPANTRFKYSNIGYALLGLAVQSASGMPYNQYVKERIVDRLSLPDTAPELDERSAARMVTGYTGSWLGVPRRPVPDIDTRVLSPAAGFYSTAEDLCRYGAAHWFGDETLLSDASKREMQHPYWSAEQSDDRYGLGLGVQKIGNRELVGHGGGFPGQSTRTLIDPVDRLVIVVLSNTSAPEGLAAPLASEIVRIIDFSLDKARAATHATGVSSDLQRYTGRFANTGGVVDVAGFGNSLFLLSPEADDPVQYVTELESVDADTFRIKSAGGYASPGELVRYQWDANGRVIRLIVAGITFFPEDIFRQRYADQPHWHLM